MSGALDGLRVLELGHWVAVPSACAILGDWGAEVVKVEDPVMGDPMRGLRSVDGVSVGEVNYWFEQVNRNKKGVALDLRYDSGKNVLRHLIQKSDVLVSNFKVAALERLGLPYDIVARLNPQIVYAVLTGFGREGQERDKPGYDYSAFWARGGAMSKMGEPDSAPPPQRPGMGDNVTSMLIAGAISAALVARGRTGVGQALDLSLFNTAVWMLGMDMMPALSAGIEIPNTERGKTRNPLWNTYRTGDGLWVQLVMIQSDRFWPAFCEAIGRPDLEQDPRFNNSLCREENCAELVSILEGVMTSRDCASWEEVFTRYQLIFGRVQTVIDVVTDPQATANSFFTQVPHPLCGELRLVASPVKFSGTPAEVSAPAPELGQHTEEVLLEVAGMTWDDLVRLKEEGAIP
ncbi:MAG: CoA transferase [Dehalococcoidia bacterium]|jgi:crotonobetainyl-CoA:carnitine CoA-transferase CaiB-like acyl-CoA transferase|nr:CoA transferase [Dehalococcoidia bacterium]MDP7470299.1 CoA transferase [Dehalococcoidia bacterium]